MKLITSSLFIVFASVVSVPVWGFGSYVSPYQITVSNHWGALSFDYTITGERDDGASDGVVSCGDRLCAVGFYSRTGLGPSPEVPSVCDSGGTCIIIPDAPNGYKFVLVANSTKWDDAYIAYINKFGRTGNNRLLSSAYDPESPMYPGVKWGSLCVGFASLPLNKSTVSQLAPGAACAGVTPPDTSCFFAIQNTIDFGVVNTGDTPKPVTVYGGYSCGAVNSVSASIGTSPFLGGAPLRLYMNGVLLSNTATRVARDKTGTLTLRAEFASPLVTVGSHQASVPVLMAFY